MAGQTTADYVVLSGGEMSKIEIMQGDCLEVMRGFEDNQFDLVITSPPYNLGNNHHTNTVKHNPYDDNMDEQEYQRWQISVMNECFRICKDSMLYNHQNRIKNGSTITPYEWILKTCWILKQEIVWNRRSPNMDKCRFFPFTERIYWLSRNKETGFFNRANLTDDLHISPVGLNNEHSRQYPVRIPKNIVECFPENYTILDPFLGSGTTAVACERMGRNCVGIEISPEYCEIARKRVQEEKDKMGLFPE